MSTDKEQAADFIERTGEFFEYNKKLVKALLDSVIENPECLAAFKARLEKEVGPPPDEIWKWTKVLEFWGLPTS